MAPPAVRLRRLGGAVFVGAAALAVVSGALCPPAFSPALAQEPDEPPAPADTVLPGEPADTILPAGTDTVPLVRPDLGLPGTRLRTFPPRPVDAEGGALAEYECDRDCLLEAPWLTLAELVAEVAPGVLAVRGAWFGGPHHVVHGLGGPGSVRVILDGRELVPLESGQVDLLRIPLVQLDGVRIYRRAGGLRVVASSRRQEGPSAYSRLLGGTAQPRGELLRGIFTSRWGRDFSVGAALDLVDVLEEGRTNDRLDFFGRVSWMPGAERVGFELEYHSQNLTRTGADTVELGRRELFLRGRANLGGGVVAEALAGRTELRQEDETIRSVEEVGLAVGALLGETRLSGSVGAYEGEGVATARLRAAAATRLPGGLRLEAGGEIASWPDFVAPEAWSALSTGFELGVPFLLRAEGATGRRGLPRPAAGAADSVSFDAVAAEIETVLGPYRLRGRGSWERTGRQHPFHAPFDRSLASGPAAEITAWELGAAGPVLPLGWLVAGLGTITGDGFWRRQEPVGDGMPLYAPRDLGVGRLLFREDFFQGNLEIRLGASVTYRGETLGAHPGLEDPVVLPAHTWFTSHFQFRIADFRFFWKVLNPAALAVQEVGGVALPRQWNVFGIQWEFFD